jgi:hypothetical protein
MNNFFAGLFEWWGLMPLYATDLGDHLRGYDISCNDYVGTPWYSIIGVTMISITVMFFALQYNIIDSTRYNAKIHTWISALIITFLNFLIPFTITFNTLHSQNYCNELVFTVSDCLGLGISVSLWSFFLFALITSIPWLRGNFSRNCRHTTLWKP